MEIRNLCPLLTARYHSWIGSFGPDPAGEEIRANRIYLGLDEDPRLNFPRPSHQIKRTNPKKSGEKPQNSAFQELIFQPSTFQAGYLAQAPQNPPQNPEYFRSPF